MLTKKLTYFLKLALILILAIIIFNNDGDYYSFKVLFTSFLISSFSIVKILSKKEYVFSLNTIFYLFILFFIGLAPALQYKKGIYFLGDNSKLSEVDFITGNIIFIICILIYNFAYQFFSKKKLLDKLKKKNSFDIEFSSKTILFLSLAAVIIIFSYFSFNLEALFQRRLIWNIKGSYNSVFLSLINVVRGIPLILFLIFKLSGKKNVVTEIVLLLIIILCNFPLGIPRYKIAVIYLPVLLIYFKPILKRQVFPIAFVTLFLSVFPYLHHFRYNNNLVPEKLFDLEMFTEAHFDTYQNSVNIITNNIITNGDQILGTALFFVPRTYWEGKSQGSGHVLTETLEYNGFSNVAVSYFAEGYINFGYLGVLFFVLFLALVNATLDRYYWLGKYKKIIFQVSYLIFIPFQFFILRGSLMSSVANFIGYILCIVVLCNIIKQINSVRILEKTP